MILQKQNIIIYDFPGGVRTSNLFHVEIKHKNIHNVMQIYKNCSIILHYLIKIVIEVTL